MNETDPSAEIAPPGPISRTAVLAAMFAVPCICPPMSLIACITGVVALRQMRGDATARGRGLAWAAIVVGAASAAAMSLLLWQSGLGLVLRGPQPPLQALMQSDRAAMQDQWNGPAAELDQATLQSCASEITARYGSLQAAEPSASRPLPLKSPESKPIISVPITLRFERATLEADLGLQLFEERSRKGVMRWRSLRIIDPERGDLVFPPGEPPPPPPPTSKPLPNPAAAPEPNPAPSPTAAPALR